MFVLFRLGCANGLQCTQKMSRNLNARNYFTPLNFYQIKHKYNKTGASDKLPYGPKMSSWISDMVRNLFRVWEASERQYKNCTIHSFFCTTRNRRDLPRKHKRWSPCVYNEGVGKMEVMPPPSHYIALTSRRVYSIHSLKREQNGIGLHNQRVSSSCLTTTVATRSSSLTRYPVSANNLSKANNLKNQCIVTANR
jgi:hypothetical protein